jgi:hypothetical protein
MQSFITYPIPSTGIHHLKLKIVTSEDGQILVGVCPSSIKSKLENFDHCGWYFDCSDGTLFSGPPQREDQTSYYSIEALESGREVGVKMDMTNGQISFTVDEVDRGVAYKDFQSIRAFVSVYCCIIRMTL